MVFCSQSDSPSARFRVHVDLFGFLCGVGENFLVDLRFYGLAVCHDTTSFFSHFTKIKKNARLFFVNLTFLMFVLFVFVFFELFTDCFCPFFIHVVLFFYFFFVCASSSAVVKSCFTIFYMFFIVSFHGLSTILSTPLLYTSFIHLSSTFFPRGRPVRAGPRMKRTT